MANVYLSFSLSKRCEDAPQRIVDIWNEYDSHRDSSEEALEEFYINESHGKNFSIIRNNGKINAYMEGQKWFNLTKTEYWKPDIKSGELTKEELYDGDIPDWFLDKVLKDVE